METAVDLCPGGRTGSLTAEPPPPEAYPFSNGAYQTADGLPEGDFPSVQDNEALTFNRLRVLDHRRIQFSVPPASPVHENAGIKIFRNGVKLSPSRNVLLNRQSKPPGGTRGRVREFSPAARRRLMRLMAEIHTDLYGVPVFVTLTYHDDWERRDWKRDVKVYLQRVLRLCPGVDYIWRVELQKRGAPHFHLMFFSPKWDRKQIVSAVNRDALARAWLSLINPDADDVSFWKYGAKVEPLQSFRKMMKYCSKYVAKQTSQSLGRDEALGRRWGRSATLATETIAEYGLSDQMDMEIRRVLKKWLQMKPDKGCRRYADMIEPGVTNFVFVEAQHVCDMIDWVFAAADTPAGRLPP